MNLIILIRIFCINDCNVSETLFSPLQVEGDPAALLRVPGPAATHVAHLVPREARGHPAGGHQEGHRRRRPRRQADRQKVS